MKELIAATATHFWQIVGIIFAIAFSIIAIRVSFNVDINKLLERRDKNNLQKLKNACPHFMITALEGREFEVRSLFYKPAGTLSHVCRQCGIVTPLDFEQHERDANYYLKSPSELIKAQERFTKLAKKFSKIA